MPTAYVTAPPDAAGELARTLVEERHAACVNCVECTSTYRWEGTVHTDEEVVLFAKTTAENYEDLVAHVREHHPYEVPCIERFDEAAVEESFAAWIGDAVE